MNDILVKNITEEIMLVNKDFTINYLYREKHDTTIQTYRINNNL